MNSSIDHVYFNSFRDLCKRDKIWPKAVDRSFRPRKLNDGPKTLVCHDMKGGYLAEDKLESFEVAESKDKPFIFTHWWYTDIFIYFSHHFITVPTVRWINQCHDHNVLCLGTFITENATGRELCTEIFANDDNINTLVDHLVSLCEEFHFDGWLINIENVIDWINTCIVRANRYVKIDFLRYMCFWRSESIIVRNIARFLYKLRRELKFKIGPQAQLIWYDSVRADGALDWQNELNASNVLFAEVVDAFYTNYAWQLEHLKRTRHYLQTEKPLINPTNIYFGVDIFGRGSFAGGQFNTHVAVQAARNYGFSVALFAPGWTTECFADDRDWLCNHHKIFRSMVNTLYAHRLDRSFQTHFSIGRDGSKFNPAERTIFPFILESGGFKLVDDGLEVTGERESKHVLFLTDFRAVCNYQIDYNCPDQLMITAQTSECTECFAQECPQLKLINIWEIYCVKLTDEPVLLNYLSVSVKN